MGLMGDGMARAALKTRIHGNLVSQCSVHPPTTSGRPAAH
jgi:hypothetical protein